MNPEEAKERQYQALSGELNALLALNHEEYKKRLKEVDSWFDAEFKKATDEIEKPTGQPTYTAEELTRLFSEKLDAASEEAKNGILSITTDIKAKLKDIQFTGRVEELLNEINADEWKKYFGDL